MPSVGDFTVQQDAIPGGSDHSSIKQENEDMETKVNRKSPEMADPFQAEEPDSIMKEHGIGETEVVEDGLITAEMLEEEEKLRKEFEKEERKQQLKQEREKQKEERRQLKEAELKITEQQEAEKRVKLLKHLLTQSGFYSDFIKRQIEDCTNTPVNNDAPKKGRKKAPKKNQLAQDKALLKAHKDEANVVASQSTTNQDTEATKITPLGLQVSVRQPRLLEGGVMRDYQLQGYEWLRNLFLNGVNGMLADEMGLGKTIQTIALISYMFEAQMPNPYLVIGPLSTLSNWVSEFERFAPKLPCFLYHGTQDERQQVLKKLRKRFPVEGCFPEGHYPIFITSYEVAMKDRHLLQKVRWEIIVLDEGHRIKNYKCRLVQELKQYVSGSRLLLTGTPLQNTLTELWSLLNYLLPNIFDNLSVFESWFEATNLSSVEGDLEAESKRILALEEKDNIISTLHKILQPFMLRRVKADVELSLPPKKELLVFTPLSPMQEEMYRAILNKSIFVMLEPKDEPDPKTKEAEEGEPLRKRLRRSCASGSTDMYKIDSLSLDDFEELYNQSLDLTIKDATHQKGFRQKALEQGYIVSLNPCNPKIDLRKLVNHPYLLRFPVIPGENKLRVDEELVTSSGKMLVLDAMLAKLKQKNHKVLIFSQMVLMLDFIEEYMIMRNYNYCRLDGTRSVLDRKDNIDSFNNDPNIFAFLVSTRAGGLGINLTAADTVIIYDSDWNPQCDLQAQDRCHRIGQTRPVVVYRLTTDGTIDRRMVERATGKRRLEKMIIKKGQFHGRLDKEGTGFSANELLDLLNSKDYVKSIQSNGYVYSDKELDELLDRSDMTSGSQDAADNSKSHLYQVI